jgi:hypothetical protein
MHKISNRIFEIFFKKTLDFLLAGFRFWSDLNMQKHFRDETLHHVETFLLTFMVFLTLSFRSLGNSMTVTRLWSEKTYTNSP